MTDAATGEVLEDSYNHAPEELLKLLGRKTVAEVLDDLESMDPFARATAFNGMAAVITAFRTINSRPNAPEATVQLVAEIPSQKVHPVDLLDPHESDHPESQEPETIDLQIVAVDSNESMTREDGLPPLAEKYVIKIFGQDKAAILNRDNISEFVDIVIENYFLHFPKKRNFGSRTRELLSKEILAYFKGISDEQIVVECQSSSVSAVRVARSNLFTKLKNELSQAEVDQMFLRFAKNEMQDGVVPDLAEIEDAEEDIDTAVRPRIQDLYTDPANGYILYPPKLEASDKVEVELPTLEPVLSRAKELWATDDYESLLLLLGRESSAEDMAQAREHIANLMQKFVTIWSAESGITKLEWDILARISGFHLEQGNKAADFKLAKIVFQAKAGLKGTNVEALFASGLGYLIKQAEPEYAAGWDPSHNQVRLTASPEWRDPAAQLQVQLHDTEEMVEPEKTEVVAAHTSLGEALQKLTRYRLAPEDVPVLEKHFTGTGDDEFSEGMLNTSISRFAATISDANQRASMYRRNHPAKRNIPQLTTAQTLLLRGFIGDRRSKKLPIGRDKINLYYRSFGDKAKDFLPPQTDIDSELESIMQTITTMLKLHS